MSQKTVILDLLKNGPMTQGELATTIYGDNKHMPNIYAALMSLVNTGVVNRNGSQPAVYSLSGTNVTVTEKKEKITKASIIKYNRSWIRSQENYRKIDGIPE